MGFIEIIPKARRNKGDGKISISFPKVINKKSNNKTTNLFIRIPYKIVEQAGMKPGDKISVLYDEENPRILLLKKSKTSIGYTLVGKENGPSYKLLMSWHIFVPEAEEASVRSVEHDFHQGGIRIFAHKP